MDEIQDFSNNLGNQHFSHFEIEFISNTVKDRGNSSTFDTTTINSKKKKKHQNWIKKKFYIPLDP